MDFTSTGSSEAKSNWIRLAISLFFLTAPLSAEGPVIEFFLKTDPDTEEQQDRHPVQDFFIKDGTKPPPKPKTPIRDFFFKKSEDLQDSGPEEESYDHDGCCCGECEEGEELDKCNECGESEESCKSDCDCCN